MNGRELDLYDGVDTPADTRAGDCAPESRPGPAEHWIELVWREFPEPVRARYRAVGVAGEGGMGVVLEAHDELLDRPVAIKGPRDPGACTDAWRERLAREGRIHARLAHPNILPVFDAWTDARGLPWCAMLFVGGNAPTLAALLARTADEELERRPVGALIEIFLQMCRGVAHAHRCGVLHRDLKPENVLLGPSGEALVADWGVAATMPLESSAEIVGTPGYAAPEQMGARGPAHATERSDVHGLGVVLAEMLTGARGAGEDEMARARVPRELARIAARATDPDPERRFADADALRAAVQTYLDGGLVDGLEYTPLERLARRARANPGAAATVATGFAFSLLLAGVHFQEQRAVYRNLAKSQAFRAVAEQRAGRLEEARQYAALAYDAAQHGGPSFKLPRGNVHAIFAGRTLADALIWTARVDGQISSVHLTPDRRTLTVSTVQGTVWSIDLATRAARTHTVSSGLWMVRCSSDGAYAITAGIGTPCVLWERAGDGLRPTGASVARGTAPVALSADGKLVATAEEDGRIKLWSTPKLAPVTSAAITTAQPQSMRFSPDGRLLGVADQAGRAFVLDVPSLTIRQECARIQTLALDVAFSPDGRTLAGVGGAPIAWYWDVATGRVTATPGRDLGAMFVTAYSPDGRLLATAGLDFIVRLWDTRTHAEVARLTGHQHNVWALAFAGDGRTLISGDNEGVLRIWDVRAALDAEARRPRDPARVPRIAFAPGGRALVLSGPDRAVTRFDRATGRVIERVTAPAIPLVIGDHPRHGPVALWRTDAGVHVGFARTGAQRLAIPGRMSSSRALAFSSDVTRLAAGMADGTAAVADVDGERPPRTVPAPKGGATNVCFSPDGRRLAVAGEGGEVQVHALEGGAAPVRLTLMRKAVEALAFDASGRLLAAGGDDSTGCVVDLRTGKTLVSVQQIAPVRAVAVAPERDLLVTGGPAGLAAHRISDGASVDGFEIANEAVWGLQLTPERDAFCLLRDGQPVIWDLAALARPEARIRELAAASLLLRNAEGDVYPPPPGQARAVAWPFAAPDPPLTPSPPPSAGTGLPGAPDRR